MTTPTPLPGLIEAMASAVVEAQERIEKRQLSNLADYFDEDDRPRSIVIRMPSLQQGASPDDEDLYRAPLLPLVSTNLLRIKEVEISFDADLATVSDGANAATGRTGSLTDNLALNRRNEPRRPVVHVDTTIKGGDGKSGTVHVVLRLEGADPTEGAARLMNHLAQTQGVFQTFSPDDE